MTRARWSVLFGCLALLGFGAFAAQGVTKVSAYGYAGKSGDVTLIVDMDLARLRGGEKFIPLQIWLGHQEAKVLHADRTSFTLTDPQGKKFPLAAPEEVVKGYGPTVVSNDYSFYRRVSDYGRMSFLSCQFIPRVAFFPNPSGKPGILYDSVELPRRTYFKALLYFSNPSGKSSGDYRLTYDDPKSGTRIEVPFPIPWQK